VDTIPAYVVELYSPQLSSSLVSELESCGRLVGERAEVDLDAVADRVSVELAQSFYSHYLVCRSFDERAGSGAGALVRIQRQLVAAVQRTSKQQRADLEDELAALEAVPGVGVVVEEFLGSRPDLEHLAVLGDPFYISLSTDGDMSVATLAVDAELDWALALGGAASAGEVRRWIQLGANYAAWRDRRVRRLTRVTITTEEVWPEAPDISSIVSRLGHELLIDA
jgi:hypothetical protein